MSSHNIITREMVLGGDCIGQIDGKTIFVPFAVPGEKLKIETVSCKRDYETAKIVDILESSAHRIKPPCKFYEICGGCNMMHIESSFQRQLRSDMLKSCFKREKIETPEIIALYDKDGGYRCRFQFHDGGLSMRQSNTVVPIDSCFIASDEINEWLNAVPQEQRPKGRIHVFGGSCVVDDTESSGATMASTAAASFSRLGLSKADSKAPNRKFPRLLIESPELIPSSGGAGGDANNFYRSAPKTSKKKKKAVNNFFSGTILNHSNIATVVISGKKIVFDIRGFFQSNVGVLEKTVDILCSDLSGKNVLDMYSGAGTFSVFLADKFEKVTMVEHNRDAMVFAEINMKGRPHAAYGLSGVKWVSEHASAIVKNEGNFDAVVIDPPRSGIEREVLSWLCKTHPLRIRSLSCDPATHARDASFFVKAGYKLSKLYLLDFYPQTSHIESLAFFDYSNPY
ncbi:class I SAM-dependent RNA methyltransferase [Treponema parvum]|nr:methyltransferase [Treponema parvum]